MTEQNAEPIVMAEQISGADVIADLAARLVEGLSHECHLRETDAYDGYSAVVTAEIQLRGLDSERVEKKLTIGAHDPATPSHRITVKVEPTTASEVRERSGQEPASLERAVDGSTPEARKPARRYYTPRESKGGATK